MLAKLLAVGEIVLGLPAQAFVHAHVDPAGQRLVHRALVLLETVAAVAPESEVHAVAALEPEAREDVQFGAEVGHELVGLVEGVGRRVQVGDRVGQLLVAGRRQGVDAAVGGHDGRRVLRQDAGRLGLGGKHRDGRVERHGRTEDRTELGVGGDARRIDVGVGDVRREGELVEIVAVLRLEGDVGIVGAERQTVEIGLAVVAAHDAVLLEVAQGQEIGGLVGAAAHGQLVLRDGGVVVEGLVLPVGTLAGGGDFGRGIERLAAVVDAALVHDHHVFGGVEDFLLAPGVLPAVAAVVGDGGLALLAAARGHEHDAVGGTGAVDGGGSRVFEDLDGSDVGRVQVVDAAVNGHSVHDIERIGIVDGADAADLDLRAGTGLAGGLRDLDAGHLALEGVVDRRSADRVEGVAVHLGDGCGHDALACRRSNSSQSHRWHCGV